MFFLIKKYDKKNLHIYDRLFVKDKYSLIVLCFKIYMVQTSNIKLIIKISATLADCFPK